MPMTADACAWCFVLGMAVGTLGMVVLYAVFSLLISRPSASQIAVAVERLRGELEAQARAKLQVISNHTRPTTDIRLLNSIHPRPAARGLNRGEDIGQRRQRHQLR
jgi:hypothetical protein